MTTGLAIVIASVVVALGVGLYRAATAGRFRSRSTGAQASVLASTPFADDLGEKATLLQFSSAFCAPCRATRRTLADVSRIVPGVTHVEVDAEANLDLVRTLGILRTPTTLVLDPAGREVMRATGAPTPQAVIASLDRLA